VPPLPFEPRLAVAMLWRVGPHANG